MHGCVCARALERTRAIFLFTLGLQINSLPSINLCTNKNLAGRQMQLTHIMGVNRRERAYSYALIGNICRSDVNTLTWGPCGSTVGRVAVWLKRGRMWNCGRGWQWAGHLAEPLFFCSVKKVRREKAHRQVSIRALIPWSGLTAYVSTVQKWQRKTGLEIREMHR